MNGFIYIIKNTVNNKVLKIKELGYKDYNDVLMIIKKYPRVLVFKNERLKKWINEMVELGYNKEKVLMMIRLHPQLFDLGINSIKEKLFSMIKYIKEDVPLQGLSNRWDITLSKINSKKETNEKNKTKKKEQPKKKK